MGGMCYYDAGAGACRTPTRQLEVHMTHTRQRRLSLRLFTAHRSMVLRRRSMAPLLPATEGRARLLGARGAGLLPPKSCVRATGHASAATPTSPGGVPFGIHAVSSQGIL